MIKNDITITIPYPHGEDIGKELLRRILRLGGISKKEWEQVRPSWLTFPKAKTALISNLKPQITNITEANK